MVTYRLAFQTRFPARAHHPLYSLACFGWCANDLTGHILQWPDVTDVSKCFPPILSTRMTWVWEQLRVKIIIVYSFMKSDTVQCDGYALTFQINPKFHHHLHWWKKNDSLKRQDISMRIFNSNLGSQIYHLCTEFFVVCFITSRQIQINHFR